MNQGLKILLVAITFSFLPTSCTREREIASSPDIQEGISTDVARMLVGIATERAESLGYKTNLLNHTVRETQGVFSVTFYPKPKKGVVTFGGGLVVYMNETGKIIKVEHGP